MKQEIIEQKELLEDMTQEVDDLRLRTGHIQERKANLQENVEGLTEKFVDEAGDLRKDLDESKAEVIKFKQMKD